MERKNQEMDSTQWEDQVSHISTRVKESQLMQGDTVQGDINHRDYMTSLYVEAGKKINWVTPFIGYSQDYLRRGSFSESNAAWE